MDLMAVKVIKMNEWKKFTGSAELLEEMRNAKNGLMVRTKDGFESLIINRESITVCASGLVEEYLICEPHPHEEMIIQWAMTGQPVYIRNRDGEFEKCLFYPTWDGSTEYSFNPPKEKKFIEVRDYLYEAHAGDFRKRTAHKKFSDLEDAESAEGFIRWLDADWRKIEI